MRRRLLDIGHAAEYLDTSVRHLRHLIATRRIPFVRVGKLIRFDQTEIEHWLDAHRVPLGGTGTHGDAA